MMRKLLVTGLVLGVVASVVFSALGVANTVYIANAGPNWFALRPSGYIQTWKGWRQVRDEHPVVYPGLLDGTYAVVTDDGSSYIASKRDTMSEVLVEIHKLLEAQTRGTYGITLAQGTHP